MRTMKTTVTINKPVAEVWAYVNDPDNMTKWLDGLEKYEHVSGEFGQPGAKGLMHYDDNGRKYVMEEEIVAVKENEYIQLKLTSKPLDMIIENHFKAKDKKSTKYVASAEFTRVSLVMKIMMSIFMPAKKSQAQHEAQVAKLKTLIEQA